MIRLSELVKEPGKISPTDPKANYFPPTEGPFMCAHCEYFIPKNSCHKVAGHIEPKGCCNLYEKNDKKETYLMMPPIEPDKGNV